MLTESSPSPRVIAHGKFFSRYGRKFFFKAMRLADAGESLDFAAQLALRARLEDLKEAHTTGLILTETQAPTILDLAAQAGLPALVELEVAPSELAHHRDFNAALSRIAKAAHRTGRHPALAGFLIDCPIDPGEVRAAGLERTRQRLRAIVKAVRAMAPEAMAALKLRPETRALSLLEDDFLYGEIPALEPAEIRGFVIALHNLAEARPVMIEFAQASPGQDEAVAIAFGSGAAGVVAPPIPAPASPGWMDVRMIRAAELMPFVTLNGTCPPPPAKLPMVSVVICAYNAERTMRACLESLRRLDYPNYEVVIVDDGSRDRTAEISAEFPEFRLIRQPNKGLSEARNVGLHAARGEIIAYTDSDCVVDPHWLTLMVRAMTETNFDGCGGPNYAPHEEEWIAACCAASPGAPSHVLTGDERAEHLAGCNMIFTKDALLKVGGFDPQFTAAGDDVDICWRLLDAGFKLGFCPAAFVWHFRRNTIKAYYGQQRGYGRAEALLYPRYAARFNAMGQIGWRGTIPGIARTIPGAGRKRIWWTAANASAQTLFDSPLTLAETLPQTLEWNLLAALALIASFALGWPILPAAAMLAMGPAWALYYAWHAPLERCHDRLAARSVVAYLAYAGPMVRAISRYKTRANAMTEMPPTEKIRQRPALRLLSRAFRLAYWNEAGVTRDRLIERLLKLFTREGYPALVNRGWNDCDLELRANPWTRAEIKTADEEHPGGRFKNHAAVRIKLTPMALGALAAGAIGAAAFAAAGLPEIAMGTGALTIAAAICLIGEMIDTGRIAYRAIEECAAGLELIPLGKPLRAPAAPPAAVPSGAPAPAPIEVCAAAPQFAAGSNRAAR
ncbi:MAG: glycosyltransferase [Candidatus Binataceae bacterium]